MNGPFQTAQQPTATALPIEFEVLAPPLLLPARISTTTRRCGRRPSPTSRHDRPSNGCSRSMCPNSLGRSSATACCATKFSRSIGKRPLKPRCAAST